ncbi:MAG: threonylcarbamoyl-AMP synthase [Ectothiorhodospiraceae bacterium]|nr:threonylcarbamoyl-AMP synthase [Ectothiorhodospiraceae bacterium]
MLHTAGKDADPRAIAFAAEEIRDGGLVAFPTETVYGLGAEIYNEGAIRKIFEVKGRPPDNPLIVHIADPEQGIELMQQVPDRYNVLATAFMPGPLTLVVQRNASVLDVVTAGLETVAIRMPSHPLALELIRAVGAPLAAPSANVSGNPSPTTAEEAYEELDGKVAFILDGGRSDIGIESTVLDITGSKPVILRPGMITGEDISGALHEDVLHASEAGEVRSPGVKYRHYMPAVPMTLFAGQNAEDGIAAAAERLIAEGQRVGVLAPERMKRISHTLFYSLGKGATLDYAKYMYSGLRFFSAQQVDVLLCAGIEEEHQGLAIMNRLRKAATTIREIDEEDL